MGFFFYLDSFGSMFVFDPVSLPLQYLSAAGYLLFGRAIAETGTFFLTAFRKFTKKGDCLMDDIWNRLKQVAEQGGRKAACQVKKWGDQASAQGRLWQIRREIRELYVKIGRCCWEKYRRESEPLFSELFSPIRLLEQEQQSLEMRIHQRKDSKEQ